jgi:DNA-directed RNA polymerase specialized sigma24 family protein
MIGTQGHSMMSVEADNAWSLSRDALDRLLRQLGDDPTAAAHEYEVIRRKLVVFFKARALSPAESLADEVIDRVAFRLENGEAIAHLRAYFFGVARLVAFEWHRRDAAEKAAQTELQREVPREPDADLGEHTACLKRCLKKLPKEDRALILAYYRCDAESRIEERKKLAEASGITYTALKTRAHRIRRRLDACLKHALASDSRSNP